MINFDCLPDKKLKPPEYRLECSTCGYTASESIFKEKHKTCPTEKIYILVLVLSV